MGTTKNDNKQEHENIIDLYVCRYVCTNVCLHLYLNVCRYDFIKQKQINKNIHKN